VLNILIVCNFAFIVASMHSASLPERFDLLQAICIKCYWAY